MQVNKSLAIPMPASHIHRTNSEVQLHEDTAVAEYRDQCMLNRLVRGICKRKHQSSDRGHNDYVRSRDNFPACPESHALTKETNRSIEHMTSTRNHLSQGFGKVTPTYSGERYRFQQSDTYQTDESMQLACHRSQELDDWAIEGFGESMSMSNMSRDSAITQTELIPDMYESDDSSFHDDEVFDIDL